MNDELSDLRSKSPLGSEALLMDYMNISLGPGFTVLKFGSIAIFWYNFNICLRLGTQNFCPETDFSTAWTVELLWGFLIPTIFVGPIFCNFAWFSLCTFSPPQTAPLSIFFSWKQLLLTNCAPFSIIANHNDIIPSTLNLKWWFLK